MTATLTKWYEEHGRHEIFAGGKKVKMEVEPTHYLMLREELVTNEVQHDLDKLGIAKNSREEKMRARDAKQKATAEARGPQKNDEAYNARMASLYREVVLKEKPVQSRGWIHSAGRAGEAERWHRSCTEAGSSGAGGGRLGQTSAVRSRTSGKTERAAFGRPDMFWMQRRPDGYVPASCPATKLSAASYPRFAKCAKDGAPGSPASSTSRKPSASCRYRRGRLRHRQKSKSPL